MEHLFARVVMGLGIALLTTLGAMHGETAPEASLLDNGTGSNAILTSGAWGGPAHAQYEGWAEGDLDHGLARNASAVR